MCNIKVDKTRPKIEELTMTSLGVNIDHIANVF